MQTKSKSENIAGNNVCTWTSFLIASPESMGTAAPAFHPSLAPLPWTTALTSRA